MDYTQDALAATSEDDTAALESYDVIMIGTSQGGRILPVELAKAGHKVALVERGPLGGVCVNFGCTPTKTMVASARLAYQARRGAEYGVHIGPVSVDLAAVRERKRAMVSGARQNFSAHLAQDGLDLVEGEAHFAGPKTVHVALTGGGSRQLSAPVIIIDTGARSRPLSIPGADQVPVLDSTSIMELAEVPEHLIIVGGGYIGLEFGQMFRRFGSEVIIVETGRHLLSREDEDVSQEVTAILQEEGVTVLTSSTPLQVEAVDGGVRLMVEVDGAERHLEGSHLLAAVGRIPNTDALNPEAAGIRLDHGGFIEVNDYLETSVAGIYAMGDVKGGLAFTHVSYDDYRILHANLIRHDKATTRARIVPYTVFIDPQLGRVGMSEREAEAAGHPIRVAKLPMSAVIRAIETGETRGFIKAIIDAENGEILGGAVLGTEGGELMAMIQIAMLGHLTATQMANAIFTHPLLAEGLNTVFAM